MCLQLLPGLGHVCLQLCVALLERVPCRRLALEALCELLALLLRTLCAFGGNRSFCQFVPLVVHRRPQLRHFLLQATVLLGEIPGTRHFPVKLVLQVAQLRLTSFKRALQL